MKIKYHEIGLAGSMMTSEPESEYTAAVRSTVGIRTRRMNVERLDKITSSHLPNRPIDGILFHEEVIIWRSL